VRGGLRTLARMLPFPGTEVFVIAELSPPAAAPAAAHVVDVAVTQVPSGGWQITATLDGQVVATQHCDDWHRVERVRDGFARRAWASFRAGR
jgi:hypothetical protein